MAVENKANYTKIGLALFFGTIAIAVTLCWLGGIGGRSKEFLVETYYDDPVGGLSAGSPVNFRGVKIGTVKEIGFTSVTYEDDAGDDEAQRVRIVMAIRSDLIHCNAAYTPERVVKEFQDAGLRATVELGGVTGLCKVELSIPDHPKPVPKLAWKPIYPVIHPQPSLLNSFSKSATMVMNRFNRIDFGGVWSNIQSMASSSASVASTLDEFLESERSQLSITLGNIDALASDLRDLAAQLKANPSLLIRANDPEPLPETAR